MDKIYGVAAVTPMLVPDWNQTNPNRSDYIKNKPEVANALKGYASGNPITIADVSPLSHEMAVSIKSRNLLKSMGLRTVRSMGAFSNTTARSFDGSTLIVGLSYNNYYAASNVSSYEFDEENNSFKFVSKSVSYGISFDMPCEGGKKYAVSFESGSDVNLNYSYYDENGFHIDGSATSVKTHTLTTPANAKWIVLGFSPRNSTLNTEITISKPCVTENDGYSYSPYVEINGATVEKQTESGGVETYTADKNGTVEGIGLSGEEITLSVAEGGIITAEYNRDTNKVIESLVNAIISLGGNV